MKETFYGITNALKKFHHFMFLKIKVVTNVYLYFIKIKFISYLHYHDKPIQRIQLSLVYLKTAAM